MAKLRLFIIYYDQGKCVLMCGKNPPENSCHAIQVTIV